MLIKRTIRRRLAAATACLLLLDGFCLAQPADIGDREGLSDLCARYSLAGPRENGSNICVRGRNVSLTFEVNSRKLFMDNLLVWMNSPLLKENNSWTLCRADVATTIEPLLSLVEKSSAPETPIVVIDPGHGGKDTGAIGANREVVEKKVVLDIAKRVIKKLKNSGINARLSRKRDSTLTLDERTARARKWGADIFVSIHVNSAANTNAAGIETYILPSPGFPSTAGERSNTNGCPANKFDKASVMLAYRIHSAILSRVSGVEDRGMRRARFDVLCAAPCPAVLVECGFVSNGADEERLRHEDYLDAVADGIARGILAYAGKTNE